jgi:hypothetical protein
MSRQSLPRILATLRTEGVSEAEFHPDGRLARVTFGAPIDPDAEQSEPEPARITGARAALQVLRGQRRDLAGTDKAQS